jgi:hypothetical protein
VVAWVRGWLRSASRESSGRREVGAFRALVWRRWPIVGFAMVGSLIVVGVLGASVTPKPLLSKAQLLVAASVGNGFTAHVWLAPSSTGGQCLFVTRDEDASLAHPTVFEDGGCSTKGQFNPLSSGDALNVGLSEGVRPATGKTTAWVPPTVSGSVSTKLNVVRVRITWKGGSQALKLSHGSFVGGGVALYQPPSEPVKSDETVGRGF